jgi:hypothetical protein
MNVQMAQRRAEIAQERLGLYERLEELDNEEKELIETGTFSSSNSQKPAVRRKSTNSGGNSNSNASSETNNDGTPRKRRGRPPGSGKKTNSDGAAADGEQSEGRTSLPALLTKIGQASGKPLKIADFVTKARESGYKSKGDFSNMVYQALLKLVRNGTFTRDEESLGFQYAEAA